MVPFLYLAIKSLYWSKGATLSKFMWCSEESIKPYFIKAGKNLDDILIYVKNTVSRERERGKLSTSKKNQIMHGIGLTSIQEAVEKYNGYVSIIEEDGTFQLAILFGKGQ